MVWAIRFNMIDEARARTGNRYNLTPVSSECRFNKIIIPLIEDLLLVWPKVGT